jgi:membrane protein YqaA with SNARE-associated domain
MWWQYALVFIGSLLVDIFPIPLPPAFTVMIFFQIYFHLNIWTVLALGVTGSILGRFILSAYIPRVSKHIFNAAKNEDVEFLGNKMREKGWKGKMVILIYSLMPLPTTPLFVAGGMANLRPLFMIPPFVVGKVLSDMLALFTGKYASENTEKLIEGVTSWQSICGLSLSLILLFVILFLDWRSLLTKKKFRMKFKIWK